VLPQDDIEMQKVLTASLGGTVPVSFVGSTNFEPKLTKQNSEYNKGPDVHIFKSINTFVHNFKEFGRES
jgi:hypothetical protein